MKKINNYILEKLKITKDIDIHSDNPSDYRLISIDDASKKDFYKDKVEKFIDKYKDNTIYCKKNDTYLYILPEDEAYDYLGDFDVYSILLVNYHKKTENKPDFIEWDSLKKFIKDCEEGKVDYQKLFYES